MPTSTASARLVTPEQFVKHIQTQFGLDLSKPYQGRSPALQRYTLPLGGLDHDTVYERDRQIKVQNLLAAQAISWEAALYIMDKEKNKAAPTPDQPEWKDRLQDFFLRIHSRPPTDPEFTFLEERFRKLLERNVTPSQAWTAVVYILLASVEFWTL